MPRLIYSTLLAEGKTDEVLCRHLTWLLEEHVQNSDVVPTQLADFDILSYIPKEELARRMVKTYLEFPCEILFVHRDADSEHFEFRQNEIKAAYDQAKDQLPDTIAVVPVQETEAWLMFDEEAIRFAANNPSGGAPLDLPPPSRIEATRRPKEKLYEALNQASMRNGRQPRDFDAKEAAKRIVERIQGFAPLRALRAFRELEQRIKALATQNRW